MIVLMYKHRKDVSPIIYLSVVWFKQQIAFIKESAKPNIKQFIT